MKTIGEQIKAMRIKRGLTMQQLANRCGAARDTVNDYESGRTNPSRPKMEKIAKVLGCEYEILLIDTKQ